MICETWVKDNEPQILTTQKLDSIDKQSNAYKESNNKGEKGFRPPNIDTVFDIQTIEDEKEYIRIYIKSDTSILLADYGFAQTEYFELIRKNNSGEDEILKSKTNFLDLMCRNYYKTEIIDGKFSVNDNYNDSISSKICINKDGSGDYNISYIDKELKFKKRIVSSYMATNLRGYRAEIENYQGRYIHLWLADSSMISHDSRFLAIGISSNQFVYEFHFPRGYKIGTYFTPKENLVNKNVKTYSKSFGTISTIANK